MAERGDVVQLKRRLGFGEARGGERLVVIQTTRLNAALPTVIVVPLDDSSVVANTTLGVRVSADEAGSRRETTAVTWHVKTLLADRLAAGRVGRLEPRTLAQLDDKLRIVMGL